MKAEDKMQQCLGRRNEQALRLLNRTGVTNIPQPLNLDGMDSELYRELLQNASIVFNETLVTCNKTEFLKVRKVAIRLNRLGLKYDRWG